MSDIATVGQVVADFEMDAFDPVRGDFKKISLADLKAQKKWTVLVFYPGDYTFVCPTELADLAKIQPELAKKNVEVISVSTDSKFVHLAWQREETILKDIRYAMGADPNGKVSRQFGVYDESIGMALRGTFIINPQGKLAASEINFYNVGRSAAELLRKINANLYVADHPDEACPANWTEGAKSLKPGAGLVGRVGEALRA